MKERYFLLLAILWLYSPAASAQSTVGLITHTKNSLDSGYVLFAPIASTNTYLIDKCGKLVHSWASQYRPGLSVYLLPDGSLLRTGATNGTSFNTGGKGGVIEKLDWDGKVNWHYTLSDSTQCQHHDITPLPDGHILAIVWELKTNTQAIAAGRDSKRLSNALWSEKIVEIAPSGTDSGTIVWEWHAWDHLVQNTDSLKPSFGKPADHPELIDINFTNHLAAKDDWLHINGIDYNPKLDQILLSVHNWSEIWIIDHSTTTAEAASHSGGKYNKGGDLLYRWGNPQAYGEDTAPERLYGQHNAHWMADGLPSAGKIMLFNNGIGRDTPYSTVEILTPPQNMDGSYVHTLPYGPSAPDWIYKDPIPGNFYSNSISGAQMLVNGNVLVCDGMAGNFFEVDDSSQKAWVYNNPVDGSGPVSQGSKPTNAAVFRCTFYPYSYAGFKGHTLTPGDPIEKNPSTYTCALNVSNGSGIPAFGVVKEQFSVYPNPSTGQVHISGLALGCSVRVYNILGKEVLSPYEERELNLSALPKGVYFIQICSGNAVFSQRLILR